VVETLSDPNLIDGPWDLTINENGPRAQVFVSNVLSGTVTRIDLSDPRGAAKPIVLDEVQIASGFTTEPNGSALVLGPTGLAFDAKTGTLFVASTADNEIFAIPNAGTRTTDAGTGSVAVQDQTHLHGPLGLVLAPNGDLIVANGDAQNTDPTQPSEIVEFTQSGQFVSQFSLDSSVDAPFGIAIASQNGRIHFAAVNDNNNMVSIWTLPEKQHNQ
jgi:DNA-binding beta-propeller fold protein YncE